MSLHTPRDTWRHEGPPTWSVPGWEAEQSRGIIQYDAERKPPRCVPRSPIASSNRDARSYGKHWPPDHPFDPHFEEKGWPITALAATPDKSRFSCHIPTLTEKMSAHALCRLPSNYAEDTKFDEMFPEYIVYHVTNAIWDEHEEKCHPPTQETQWYTTCYENEKWPSMQRATKTYQ